MSKQIDKFHRKRALNPWRIHWPWKPQKGSVRSSQPFQSGCQWRVNCDLMPHVISGTKALVGLWVIKISNTQTFQLGELHSSVFSEEGGLCPSARLDHLCSTYKMGMMCKEEGLQKGANWKWTYLSWSLQAGSQKYFFCWWTTGKLLPGTRYRVAGEREVSATGSIVLLLCWVSGISYDFFLWKSTLRTTLHCQKQRWRKRDTSCPDSYMCSLSSSNYMAVPRGLLFPVFLSLCLAHTFYLIA